jgi:hypothetical protein
MRMTKYTGSGESTDNPIIITEVQNHMEGVRAEYEYIQQQYGPRGSAWTLIQQSLLFIEDTPIDKMDIQLADGTHITLYFDISSFFGQY